MKITQRIKIVECESEEEAKFFRDACKYHKIPYKDFNAFTFGLSYEDGEKIETLFGTRSKIYVS